MSLHCLGLLHAIMSGGVELVSFTLFFQPSNDNCWPDSLVRIDCPLPGSNCPTRQSAARIDGAASVIGLLTEERATAHVAQ